MSSKKDSAREFKAIALLFVLILTVSMLALNVGADPESPTLFLRAKATEDKLINLEWEITNDTGVVKYNIYWDTKEFDDVSGMTPDATTTEMEYTVKGLERGVEWYFMVTAVDSSDVIIAQGTDWSIPGQWEDAGDLKEVDFWRVMTFTGIILVIFIYVLKNVPKWVKEEEAAGGA